MESVEQNEESESNIVDELEKLNLGKAHIQKMLNTAREDVKELTVQYNVFHHRAHNLRSDFERIYSRKQTLIWWLVLVCSFLLLLHTYTHQAYVFCLLNGYAFLINWKSLYVKEIPWAKFVAFTINVITLKLV